MDTSTKTNQDLIEALSAQRQPVTADDSMAEAGRKVLLSETVKMLKHESGSRTGGDIEDVHDMRVAIRRMRSAFRLLEPYFKSKSIAPLDLRLRKLARVLGVVRDLDVQIDDLEKAAVTMPEHADGLNKVIALLDARRREGRADLVRHLDRGSYRRFVDDYAAFLLSPGKGTRELDAEVVQPSRVRHILPEMIYRHLGAVRAYHEIIGDADVPTLHALRIEFKRLRYVLSLFGEVLGTGADEFIEELKAIQDHLGRLNDMSIAHERLHDLRDSFTQDSDADALAALDAYIATIDAEHDALYEGFGVVWRKFNTKKVQRALAMAVAGL